MLVLVPVPANPSVRGAAVLAEESGIEDHRALEAHTARQLILLAHRPVHLRVEGIGRLFTNLGLLIVVLAERRPGDVRFRNERQQPSRDRADAVLRDLVVGKRCAAGAVDGARRRVVNASGDGAEVAVAHRHRRNRRADDIPEVVDRSLVIAEEEELVADDRAAKCESTLREFRRWLQVRERGGGPRRVVARVGGLGVAKEEPAPFEVVRSRFQRDVGDRAARSAKLRVVVAGRDADGLERVSGRE